MQGVVVPDIELVVETPGEHDPHQVGHEEGQDQQLTAVGHGHPAQLAVGGQELVPVLQTVAQHTQMS